MLRIGIAGVGFMGMVHYLSYAKLRGVKVAALCDDHPERLAGDWRAIKGNFGPPGQKMDLGDIARYSTLDEMLADESLDMVDLTLPPSLHADATVKALAAGKHVFCEKPMALEAAECRRMSKAAEKAQKQLLIGHVLPFFPEYSWALKEIRSGKHGKLLGGAFRRVISDPEWLDAYWKKDRIRGPMFDLHVHDAHFIRLLFGQPKAVKTTGRSREGLPEFWNTQFEYGADGPAVTATSGVINQQGRPFNHGFEIHLEKATLQFEFAIFGDDASYLCPPTIIVGKRAKQPKLSGGDPMDSFQTELREVVRCVAGGDRSDILDYSLAQDAVLLCKKQEESLAAGKQIRV